MIDTQQLGVIPIQFGAEREKGEGPRLVRFNCDFSQQSSYLLDFSMLQQQGKLSTVQSLYLDNSAGTVPIIITVDVTGMVMYCEPGQFGYFPLLFGQPARCVITSPGNTARVMVYALNVSVSGSWKIPTLSTTPQTVTDPALEALIANGAFKVSDLALEALIANGSLKVSLSSGMIQPARTVTANDTATVNDSFIYVNATAAALTETLPAGLTTLQTAVLTIEKSDSSANTVTISGNGSLINGSSTYVLYNQFGSVTLQWTGAGWFIVNERAGNWQSWTPAITCGGAMTISGITIVDAQFIRQGALCYFKAYATFTLATGGNPLVYVSLPIPSVNSGTFTAGFCQISQAGGNLSPGVAFMQVSASLMVVSPTGQAAWALGAASALLEGFYRIV